MFKSAEQKARELKQKEQIEKAKAYVVELQKLLMEKRSLFQFEYDQRFTKWEYTEIDTETYVTPYEAMKEIGLQGWEMVGVSTFNTGIGGVLTIHFKYVFKRPILALSNDLKNILGEISQLENKINSVLEKIEGRG